MKTIIKWPGGKERELPLIMQNIPEFSGRYAEPFVGGGALFWAMEGHECCINDKSEELIRLYRCIADQDPVFFRVLEAECGLFSGISAFADEHRTGLLAYYEGGMPDTEFLEQLRTEIPGELFREMPGAPGRDFREHFLRLSEQCLADRRRRAGILEERRGKLSEEDRCAGLEAAVKSAFYMAVRDVYNHPEGMEAGVQAAVFWMIRECCYSSMFRYNKKGGFNVPYGGISYNRKDLYKKAQRLRSEEVCGKLLGAQIYCEDFERFLDNLDLTEEDFVFADPPYDTEFSEYAGNSFGREEQTRLFECLRKTPAKVMAVIKNTQFIYDLYKDDFTIGSFDKKYLVSFKNRNERRAEHLMITNYQVK